MLQDFVLVALGVVLGGFQVFPDLIGVVFGDFYDLVVGGLERFDIEILEFSRQLLFRIFDGRKELDRKIEVVDHRAGNVLVSQKRIEIEIPVGETEQVSGGTGVLHHFVEPADL